MLTLRKLSLKKSMIIALFVDQNYNMFAQIVGKFKNIMMKLIARNAEQFVKRKKKT